MTQKNRFRIIHGVLASVILVQVTFSLVGGGLYGIQNFYPLFSWQIFATIPYKTVQELRIQILEIDSVTLDKPLKSTREIKERFPRWNQYTYFRDLRSVAANEDQASQASLDRINNVFMSEARQVKWQVVDLKVDPVLFALNESVENEQIIKIFETKVAKK